MKKLYPLLALFSITLALFVQTASAAPAWPHPIEYKLPDGTTITVLLKGDEKVKWAETKDGYSILLNKDGFYEYATSNNKGDMERSGVRAYNPDERPLVQQNAVNQLQKQIRYSPSQVSIMKQIWNINEKESSKAFPTTGDRKLICILIGFTDKAFTKTQSDFNNLFNQVGYNAGDATGSVKDYYLENSYGQFDLTVDVAGPFTASKNMAYYGANDASDNDVKPRELVTEAVKLADPYINYANYDNDNDGTVDGVYIIYAGYGEEAGGGVNAIWAHAWAIPSITLDGKTINRYSCSAELSGSSGTTLTRIGVICHEFGHVLGAPDYYDTNYATGGEYEGMGKWDIMASGSWNNGGATPAHHNGFTKVICYNWATTIELTTASTITLTNAAQNSNSFYRINTKTSGEYYFIENREKHLFDGAIPGSGMMIYHVHSGVLSALANNTINDTHPQKMYPVAQNATTAIPTSTPSTYGTINSTTCPWTGTGRTTFSDASTPSMKSWANVNTSKPITNISRNSTAKTVTFDFMGGAGDNPTAFTAISNGSSQVDLSWTRNSSRNVLLVFNTIPTFGIPSNGTNYSVGNSIAGGGTVLYAGSAEAYSHTGLPANSTYYYKIFTKVNVTPTWSTGVEGIATTECDPFTLPFQEDFDATTTLPICWEIIDHQGDGQVWQFGTHTSGLTGSTGNYAYLNSNDYGSGNSQNADLITPTLNLTGYTNITLAFKHYFKQYTGSTAKLSYSIDNGASWNQIQPWTSNSSNPASFTRVITEVTNQSQVKFKWNYTGSWGYYWDIDDISITGTEISNNPEPTSHATTFVVEEIINTSITLNWVDATGANLPAGYLIKASSVGYADITTPSDGTAELNASLVKNIAQGIQAVTFTELTAETTYYFKIFPYSNAGSNINYKTNGTVPETSGTTGIQICTYCTPTATTNDATGITFIEFNTINNASDGAPAYTDYTAMSTSVVKGQTYSLTARVNTSGNYTVNTLAWFDWDQSCTFDAGDEVYDLGSANNVTDGQTSLSPVLITIPATAQTGATTMRIRARYNSAPTACDNENYSEAEDYAIIITDPIPQYTLTINQTGNGTVNVNSTEYTTPIVVDENTVLNLQAIAESGWQFEGWTGNLVSSNTSESVTMNGNKTITATFSEIPNTPEILVGWDFPNSPDDQIADIGIPSNTTRTINRESDFASTYSYTAGISTNCISTTTWDNGADAKYWQIDLTTTGYENVTLSSKQRSSNTGPRDFKVQYKIDGTEWTDLTLGTVTVANNFTSGVLTDVALPTMLNNQGKIYLRWIMTSNTSTNGGTTTSAGTNRMDDLIINGTSLVGGIQRTLIVSTTGTGTTNPSTGTYVYNNGTEISLSATPESGWQFDGWTGDLVSTNANESVTMNDNKTIAATFTEIPILYAVNFSVTGSNGTLAATVDGVAITTADEIVEGKDVVFTATPSVGYQVAEWTLNGTPVAGNKTNSYTISSLSASATVTVEFELIPIPTFVVTYNVINANGALTATVDGIAISSGATIDSNKDVIFTATPNDFHGVKEWKINGSIVAGLTDNNLIINALDKNINVTVEYEFKDVWSVIATYTEGMISSDFSFQSVSDKSNCPGYLTVTIPENAYITGVDVEYDLISQNQSWMVEQVSQLRCTSTGGTTEPNVYNGEGYDGTYSYLRQNLDIADFVYGGGNINFQLHVGRKWGSFNCGTNFVHVINNTWKVTVHYQMTAPTQYTMSMSEPIGLGIVKPTVGDHIYKENRLVELSAVPAIGWKFTSWVGDVANANNAETQTTINSNKAVEATFTQIEAAPLAIPYSMDFTGETIGEIPNGWHKTHNNWGVSDNSYSGAVAPEMSMSRTPYVTGELKIISPRLISQPTPRMEVEFIHTADTYVSYVPYSIVLQSSTDGLNWTNEWSLEVTESISKQIQTVDITHLANQEFYLAWVYVGYTYNGTWQIDNILVRVEPEIHVESSAITFGDILSLSSFNGSTATYGGEVVAGDFSFVNPNVVLSAGTHSMAYKFTPENTTEFIPISGFIDVVVNKVAATVTIEDLIYTYDGNAKPATITTVPAGLPVIVTYNGAATLPINVGNYNVVATINDENHQGSSEAELIINKAEATVEITSLEHTYDGVAKGVIVTTIPAGLTVETTYEGLSANPVNANSYAVVATINEVNYQGSSIETMIINRAVATISISNLVHTYDAQTKSAIVTTEPEGLNVELTYNGVATLPINADTYAVVAIVDETNYQGSETSSMTINTASLTITANSFNKMVGQEYLFFGTEFSTSELYESDNVLNATITSSGAVASAPIAEYPIEIGNATGSGLSNYTIDYVNGVLTVTDKIILTIDGLVVNNKIYDNTNVATVENWGTLGGIQNGENVSLNTDAAVIHFANEKVGNGKVVSISGLTLNGTDAPNYIINEQSATANITVRTLTLTNFVAAHKIYDGTTEVSGLDFDDDRIDSDLLTISFDADFSDKNIGDNIVVNFTNITITGGIDAANYTLAATAAEAYASILVRELTIGGSFTALNKIVDGNSNATIDQNNLELMNLVALEEVSLSNIEIEFADAEIGDGKTVSIASALLSGGDINNYELSLVGAPTTTASILPLPTYEVILASNPNDLGVILSGNGFYTEIANVTISTTEIEGYTFVGWTGIADDLALLADQNAISTTLTMPDRAVEFTAQYELNEYNVIIAIAPLNSGSVTGGGIHGYGTDVVLEATPNIGYQFLNWKSGTTIVSTTNPHTFTMPDEAVNLTAQFVIDGAQQYTISVVSAPLAGGNSTGNGTFNEGEMVAVSATVNQGYAFVNWTNATNEVVSSTPNYEFTMPANDVALTANFELVDFNVTATVNPENSGVITGNGIYNMGNPVSMTATANEGYAFVNWTNATNEVVSSTPNYEFTMPANDVALTANFRALLSATISSTSGTFDENNPENPTTVITWNDATAVTSIVTNVGEEQIELELGTDYTIADIDGTTALLTFIIDESKGETEIVCTIAFDYGENAQYTIMYISVDLWIVTFNITAAGVPISDVEVLIDGEMLMTNNAGQATIELQNGDYPYTISKDGFETTEGAITVNNAIETINVELISGIVFQSAPSVKLYPNPVMDIVTLERNTSESVKVEIYSNSGALIKTTVWDNDILKLNIEDLKNGMFHIRIIGTTIENLRFIKQ
ncbi:MAG: M6 family metalloprotease domain-containing protein [Salinivirgaceae bacterium]|nr:M6 family metalloprotease domain-containing protein [Salinivirgaceae bacterium]